MPFIRGMYHQAANVVVPTSLYELFNLLQCCWSELPLVDSNGTIDTYLSTSADSAESSQAAPCLTCYGHDQGLSEFLDRNEICHVSRNLCAFIELNQLEESASSLPRAGTVAEAAVDGIASTLGEKVEQRAFAS